MGMVTCDLSISLDGYVTGPNQRLEAPFGDVDKDALARWMFERPEDNKAEIKGMREPGAFIMGRNMFTPDRGEWDLTWKGWWGSEPPYHAPVYVLTHYPREALEMEGGTTFYFITDGIESALSQARDAAGEKNVAIAGGAATANAFLAAGLIDELRLHVAPVLFGHGERLFVGVEKLTLEPISARGNELITHMTYRIVH